MRELLLVDFGRRIEQLFERHPRDTASSAPRRENDGSAAIDARKSLPQQVRGDIDRLQARNRRFDLERPASIDDKQAQQFVFKFGLGKDKLEGQIYHAIIGTIDLLVTEIDKSIKFFMARYGESAKIERIIVTGAASVLPEFPLYIANKFGISAEIGNAWRNVSSPPNRQNELMTVSNHFGVAAGLAERNE